MIPFLMCASWVAVSAFVAIIFLHLLTARWPLTLVLAGGAVLAAAAASALLFEHVITRSCVPAGLVVAWLGAAAWAWRVSLSVRRSES